jgi:flagellar basal body-associated protein FliL
MNKRILIIGGVVLALLVQIGLAWFFWSTSEPAPEVADADGAAPGAPAEKAIYHNLRPPFVVTLPYGERQFMMQADLAVVAHQQAAVEAVIRHGPLIRARVITYLTDLDPERVQDKDGKQGILDGLTGVINDVLEGESEGVAVDSVLFNNLVMQ